MSEGATVVQNGADVSKYMYQIRKLKDALATASRDRDAFKAEADQYRNDNKDLKDKYDVSKAAQKVTELEGKLKEVEFRKTFDRVAKAKGIREDALDAAYQLGGYKPSGDEIDEDALGLAIDEQKGRQTFLAGKVETATTETKVVKPATGSGQGAKTGGGGSFTLPDDTDARWSDPVWQWNNQTNIMTALKEKRERGEV